MDGVVQKITSAARICDLSRRGYSLKSGERAENLTWRHEGAVAGSAARSVAVVVLLDEEVVLEREGEEDSTNVRINSALRMNVRFMILMWWISGPRRRSASRMCQYACRPAPNTVMVWTD